MISKRKVAMAAPGLESLLDYQQAADFLGLGATKIKQLVRAGVLPVVRFPRSRSIRFRAETLRTIAAQCEEVRLEGDHDGGIR